MVILPVMIAGALDMRALGRLAFVLLGAITIAITIDVPTLLLAIVIWAASGAA
jgi:hypothetical protein